MSGATIVFVQARAEAAAQAAAAAQPTVIQVPSMREQLRQQIEEVNRAVADSREDIQQSIRDAQQHVRDAERHLREARTDDQRGAAGQELSAARAELAGLQRASQITFHTEQPAPFPTHDMIPSQVVDMSIAFFIMLAVIIIGWPLARAMGRRIERRADAPALPDPAITGQLQRIEQAVEAMSIEIERISESQRFIAKLQNGAAERAPLGAGERR
jgi:hypothetical protein